MAVSLAIIALFFIVGFGETEIINGNEMRSPMFTDALLYWIYVLTILAVVLVLVFSTVSFFKNLKKNPIVEEFDKAVQDWYGTQPALMTHLMKNTRYPKECQEQGFQGKVVVSVNVDQDGAMSVKGGEYMPWSGNKDVSVVVNTYKNADGTQAAKLSEEELKNLMIKEAERVLKAAPKLKPYKNGKGETVRATFKVPVMFRLH